MPTSDVTLNPNNKQHPREQSENSIQGIAWIDGEYKPVEEARISVLDWGLLRSDATYDVVHVWNGRFFRLDRHLDRFQKSIDKLRLTLPVSHDELKVILANCVQQSGLENAYVEMILTRGVAKPLSRDPRDAVNNLICFAIPFGWIANEEQRDRGLHISVSSVQRISPESVDPTIKNYHWLDFVQALLHGYDGGFENVVMVDARGNLTEGPGFNVFIVEGGVLSTPSTGVLEGITRQTILDICERTGTTCEIAPVASHRIKTADEVFVTSTAGGIMPVTRVDDQPVAGGTPGPVTKRLTQAYWELHESPDFSVPVDVLLQST